MKSIIYLLLEHHRVNQTSLHTYNQALPTVGNRLKCIFYIFLRTLTLMNIRIKTLPFT